LCLSQKLRPVTFSLNKYCVVLYSRKLSFLPQFLEISLCTYQRLNASFQNSCNQYVLAPCGPGATHLPIHCTTSPSSTLSFTFHVFPFLLALSIFGRPFIERFALCYRTLSCLSACLSVCLSVCDVGVLWPNGWMYKDETWHAGRRRPWPHFVRW